MDADEREICVYLKSYPHQFISGREISRRAGGKHRFREDESWAIPVLTRLVEKGIVESDTGGHYRLLRRKADPKKKWVSPHIKDMLQKSGKDFGEVLEVEDPEAEF